MVKALSFLCSLLALVCLAAPAMAWGTGGCVEITNLHIHRDMACRVVDHPDVNWAMWWYGLDRNLVGYYAATEPQCYLNRHPSWTELRDQQHLNWGYPSNRLVGVILHVASDAGVGAGHCPACEVFTNNWAETLYEGTAETRGVPSMPSVYTGAYASRMTQFHDTQVSLTNSFKSWFNRTWYCRVYCDPWYWSQQGEINGMRLGHTALLLYLCDYADWAPAQCDQIP